MPWRRGASPSAISGEIQRHSGGCGYASHFAHMRRLRRCKFSRPPRNGAHSSICLPACASACFVLLTPASAAYPGKWPITSRGGAPQTGTSACHTKASAPAAMHSPAALSKRPCWPACATAHAPRPVPRAGPAPGDKTGAGKSRACRASMCARPKSMSASGRATEKAIWKAIALKAPAAPAPSALGSGAPRLGSSAG